LLLSSRLALSAPEPTLSGCLTRVSTALGHAYDLRDSTGQQMASLHVLEAAAARPYVGLYMAMVGAQWEVRLATSPDLLGWTFRRTLLANADMPYVPHARVLEGSEWVLLAHEQWMSPASRSPSRLGFKLYYNVSALLAGEHFNSFVAPLGPGASSGLEGTPSVYNASFVFREGYYMVDATVGFHYNDAAGKDQVAHGRLSSFGPTAISPSWSSAPSLAYNKAFIAAGAIGNIGQRDSGSLFNTEFVLQEANVGAMPPTIWKDWRVWLYLMAPGEGYPPNGSGCLQMLLPQTDGNSTAFGNPSFSIVACPETYTQSRSKQHTADDKCIFVSYFIFGEGAAEGEAGPVAFYNRLPTSITEVPCVDH